ncbi:autoinducer binding domain-containing protein [Vibrio nigripulchritudo]|uniref:Transcriptional activator protein solR-LuxR n=1 Tax=Vibrio nigripulchritudo TaxID=28173 RepID=A0A9P1JLB7_9VIBR|nr:autoinducer binding domain-containing protein [Vibrio nigripulchritudo]CBJ93133.1 Putative transcriptional activator protein solR-LuxR [Vibrio nigripulchritudo]
MEDSIKGLMVANTVSDVKCQLHKLANLLEFDNFAFGIKVNNLTGIPTIDMINTYSDQWNDIYKKNNFISKDPIVLEGSATSNPIIWEESLKPTHEIFEIANDFNLNIGWSKPSHKPNGVSSLFSFSRSSESLTEAELWKQTPYLLWVANIAEQAFERVNSGYHGYSLVEVLTPREIEILKWSAEGKTASETSMILSISERTVTFHITNAVKKLNTCNKTSAVIKAVTLGLVC